MSFLLYKKPIVIGGLDTQCVADVLEQDRAASEAIPVAAADVEAEGVMDIPMLVLCRMQAGAAEPIALLDIAQTGKVVAHNPQDIRVDRVV
ncbi:MAG: hypothetical protein CL610_15340 [Anaerolineaceae bacterium]|nr:hypothetical protein [Anaerolineaceae bacterium]